MVSAEAALARLCDPAAEVSAHYLINGWGEVVQLVDEEQRAWHAGAGSWRGLTDVNSRSIGIELANDGRSPFAAAQMDALEELLAGVLQRHGIPPEGVIGHSDMAPVRKVDPGPRFDWRRLARADLSVWPEAEAAEADWASFVEGLSAFGYPAELDRELLLRAFRLRFGADDGEGPTARETGLAMSLGALTAGRS